MESFGNGVHCSRLLEMVIRGLRTAAGGCQEEAGKRQPTRGHHAIFVKCQRRAWTLNKRALSIPQHPCKTSTMAPATRKLVLYKGNSSPVNLGR